MRADRASTRRSIRSRWRAARGALAALAVVACGVGGIVDVPNDGRTHTVSVAMGQEIDVTLGNVGPATYASPPTISSDVISYSGVDVVGPHTPAGPTQRFRFVAARRGEAVISFRRLLADAVVSVVEDTVRVH